MTSLFMYSFCRFTFYYPIHSPISTDPGVPYTVTVRASTAVGKGEPVSIVVFSVQQGDIDTIEYTKDCEVHNLSPCFQCFIMSSLVKIQVCSLVSALQPP